MAKYAGINHRSLTSAAKAEEQALWGDEDEEARSREAAALRLGKTQRAMQMRVDGLDYAEIAADLGYGTAEAAAADVHEALEEEFLQNGQYSAEILRMIELKRLNTLYSALLPGIQRGNSRSIDVAVKVSDRIAKMSGLDAAVRVEMTQLSDINQQIADVQREIAERQRAAAEVVGELEPAYEEAEIVD
jgi:hypothetical protein